MNELLRLTERILKTLWRASRAVGGWSYREGWQKPKAIRGWKWTLGLWAFLVPSCWLTAVLFATKRKEVLPLLVLQGLALWLMDHEWHKEKKLGRPLPYRRRR